MKKKSVTCIAWCITVLLTGGCSHHRGTACPAPTLTPASAGQVPAAAGGPLADTRWRLVHFQSMDDATGTVRPDDSSRYVMHLHGDGTVTMRLNCNRANGRWSAEPASDTSSGRFEFGPLAATRAACPPPSMDEMITTQAQYVRSYLLKDGRLYLSLMADGGIFAWEPDTGEAVRATPDPVIEAAILRAFPSYTRSVAEMAGGVGKGRYVYGRADLNGDGREEVLVYLMGSIFCGTGGCTMLLLTPGPDDYTLVSDFTITRPPVIVAPTAGAGWRDLWRLESGGGMAATYVRHRYDGTRYVEAERVPAERVPPGTVCLGADITYDRGIPLEPRQ